MSVYKRGGIWYARKQIGGRRIERSLGPQASREKAEEYEAALAKQLRDDLHAHRTGKPPNRSFGAALLAYLQDPEAKALRSYQSLLSVARLIAPHLERTPIENTPEVADDMRATFLNSGLAPATINRRLALVRRVLKWAHGKKWTVSRLTISLLTEHNERHIYPTADTARKLADAAGGDNGDAI